MTKKIQLETQMPGSEPVAKAAVKKPVAKRKTQRDVIKIMQAGGRICPAGRNVFRVQDKDGNPIMNIRSTKIKALERKQRIIRKDKFWVIRRRDEKKYEESILYVGNYADIMQCPIEAFTVNLAKSRLYKSLKRNNPEGKGSLHRDTGFQHSICRRFLCRRTC